MVAFLFVPKLLVVKQSYSSYIKIETLPISAMFYSTRYICTSIGISNSDVWSKEEFNVFL